MTLPTRKSKKRLLFLLITVTVLFFGLCAKIGIIIFVQGEDLQEMARNQQMKDVVVSAERGEILDRNGNVLAQSATAQTVVLRPAEIEKGNVDAIVSALAQTLDMDEETVRSKATDETKTEVWLKRQISKDTAEELQKMNLPGVYFTVDVRRYYPNGSFLTQTLGLTDVDGIGQEGIEAYFNNDLAGQDGKAISETDNKGRTVPLGEQQYTEAVDGYNVVLTVDEVIQTYLEQALNEACAEQNALSAYGIAMDPNTGEILSLANMPDYDLNDPPRDDIVLLNELSKNKVITSVFEPGSVFEAITCAAALDSAITEDETFDCTGSCVIEGQMITCWKYPGTHGSQTLKEAVQNACNPAFAQMSQAMGTQTFYNYIYQFGFGQRTGITFPSDQSGTVMSEKYVTNSDLARIASGQSIAVTPLQLISSFSAVVNGGFLYQAQLIKRIEDVDGNVISDNAPTVLTQPVSEETSIAMRSILESIVRDGSGKNGYIAGFNVGGISGYAQKYDNDGQAIDGKMITSFIGFAPADDPQIVVLIVIDEPDTAMDFGSVCAAPYVKSVLENTLNYMGITPDYDQTPALEQTTAPDVSNMDETAAATALATVGLKYLADGTGLVVTQDPVSGTTVDKGTTVCLSMDTKKTIDDMTGKVIVPDLSGKTVMQAGQALEEAHLNLTIQGAGTAAYQSPAAGTIVDEGTEVRVDFTAAGG